MPQPQRPAHPHRRRRPTRVTRASTPRALGGRLERIVRPARLEGGVERLDSPAHDEAELRTSLDHLAGVNRWLGGRRALLRHLPALLPAGRTARILDVGTGSADIPLALAAWGRRHTRPLEIVASDVHAQMLAVALRRTAAEPWIRIVQADALDLPFGERAFDVVLLSLTLHHLEGETGVRALRELARVAGRAIVVNELERCWPNLIGARLLALTVWRRDPLTRHDGPMSVRRAFTTHELRHFGESAGLEAVRVHRHFFHRLLLLASPPA